MEGGVVQNNFLTSDSIFQNIPKSLGKLSNDIDLPKGMPPIIRAIYMAANKGVDLGSCMAAISSISQYLSNSNELVQGVAAHVIALLVGRAAQYMQKIDNPEKIQRAGKFLLDIIGKLQGLPMLGSNIKSNLDTISKFIKAKMENSKEKDEFIRMTKDKPDKLKSSPTKKDKLEKLLLQEKNLNDSIIEA